jgi:hypothetical protein
MIGTSPQIFFRPPYVGHRGWVGVNLAAIGDADLCLHIKTAWELVAPKRLRTNRRAQALDAAAPNEAALQLPGGQDTIGA